MLPALLVEAQLMLAHLHAVVVGWQLSGSSLEVAFVTHFVNASPPAAPLPSFVAAWFCCGGALSCFARAYVLGIHFPLPPPEQSGPPPLDIRLDS